MREAKGCFASVRWGLVKREKGKAAVCSPLVQHYCIRRTTCVPALSLRELLTVWDLTKMLWSYPMLPSHFCFLCYCHSCIWSCLQTAVWGKYSFVFIIWERFLTVPWIEDSFSQRSICSTHWRHTPCLVCGDKVSGLDRRSYLRLSSQYYCSPMWWMDSDCVAVQPVKKIVRFGVFFLFRHLFLPHSLSFPCFLLPFYPLTSNRTLMGPYGVDRAVHSMEFTDCENGLGKSFHTSVPTHLNTRLLSFVFAEVPCVAACRCCSGSLTSIRCST